MEGEREGGGEEGRWRERGKGGEMEGEREGRGRRGEMEGEREGGMRKKCSFKKRSMIFKLTSMLMLQRWGPGGERVALRDSGQLQTCQPGLEKS
jgi:hypothetical protein